jgi:uncharacterized protein YbaP (TraB family)
MLRLSCPLLLALLLGIIAYSAEAREARQEQSPAPVATQAYTQGLLWKVEKKGTPASYLFGTIHIRDERVTRIPEPVKRALQAARSFTMEMVVDDAAKHYFINAMHRDDGKSLRALMGDALFNRTAELMQQYGVPAAATERMKPWGVLLTLLMPLPGPGPVLDQVLFEAAIRGGKPVHQLETAEEQVAVFDSMPLDMQLALLANAVESHERLPELIEQSTRAYLARDLAWLWEINERFAQESGEATRYRDEFAQRVLHARNPRMVGRMLPQLTKGRAFIALGALHLYGERGVLKLLEKRGYRVSLVY